MVTLAPIITPSTHGQLMVVLNYTVVDPLLLDRVDNFQLTHEANRLPSRVISFQPSEYFGENTYTPYWSLVMPLEYLQSSTILRRASFKNSSEDFRGLRIEYAKSNPSQYFVKTRVLGAGRPCFPFGIICSLSRELLSINYGGFWRTAITPLEHAKSYLPEYLYNEVYSALRIVLDHSRVVLTVLCTPVGLV